MVVFEVSVNGKRAFAIGAGEFGALAATLSWDRIQTDPGPIYEGIRLSGVGQEPNGGRYLHWPDEMLKVGDEITVQIVDSAECDEPAERLTLEEKMAKIAELKARA